MLRLQMSWLILLRNASHLFSFHLILSFPGSPYEVTAPHVASSPLSSDVSLCLVGHDLFSLSSYLAMTHRVSYVVRCDLQVSVVISISYRIFFISWLQYLLSPHAWRRLLSL